MIRSYASQFEELKVSANDHFQFQKYKVVIKIGMKNAKRFKYSYVSFQISDCAP